MAFNCSYRSLNERNIRHIYSDQKLRILFPKRTHFRSLQEELPVPPLRLYPKRFYDYYPSYNIGIPRAPAFRGTDKHHVDAIVKRICKPMMRCERRRNRFDREHDNDERDGEGEGEGEGSQKGESPRDGDDGSESSRKMTPKDMDALMVRLQRPTQSWERKKYDKDERERQREREIKESSIPKLPPISPRI